MFCHECGAPNDEDAIFCGNCGAVLDPNAVPPEVEGAEEPVDVVLDEVEFDDVAPEETAIELPATPPPPPSPLLATPLTPPTSGMAIASLVLGIGGLTVLPLLGSILAIIFGYMARSDIRKRPDQVSGDGIALAGVVLGWISVGVAVLIFLVLGAFAVCGVCGALGAGSY